MSLANAGAPSRRANPSLVPTVLRQAGDRPYRAVIQRVFACYEEVASLICAARRQRPSWGPAKLLDWLRPRHPGADLQRAIHAFPTERTSR